MFFLTFIKVEFRLISFTFCKGRDMVFFASKKFPDLQIRRIDWMFARNSLFQNRNMPLPSIILLPVDQNAEDW